MSGYARAFRKRWEHPLFKNKQEAAVWAWMTDTARWRAHEFQTRFGLVKLGRGQLLVSERTLGEDFGLGRQQIRRLMDSLENASMINRDTTHSASRSGTIITIVNYERYQGDEGDYEEPPTQGKPKRQPKGNPKPTQDQPTREEREEREEGEDKKRPSVSLSDDRGAHSDSPGLPALSLDPAVNQAGEAFAAFEQMRRSIDPAARSVALSPDRRKKLIARLDEIGGVGAWREVLGIVLASPFLRGETSRTGRLVASIDWLLKPENLRKVREGNYDERNSASGAGRAGSSVPRSAFDSVLEARALLRGG